MQSASKKYNSQYMKFVGESNIVFYVLYTWILGSHLTQCLVNF